jgi:hypothetical protein
MGLSPIRTRKGDAAGDLSESLEAAVRGEKVRKIAGVAISDKLIRLLEVGE